MQSPFNGAEIGGHAAPISEATEPLDDDSILWEHVVEATFVVRQRFRYEYPGPIADLHHRLMIVPRERHGDQKRIATPRDARDAGADYIVVGRPIVEDADPAGAAQAILAELRG